MSAARLIAITQPVIHEADSAEELVAYCARVSNPQNQGNHETAPRLLRYLVDHQHWSPFEMAHAVLELTTTRDIARQVLRHRSFSFQEFSQRYAQVQEPAVRREARLQDAKNRQNSVALSAADTELAEWWQHAQDEVIELSRTFYAQACIAGLAKEVARAVLPEGLTPSRLYMAGSLRSWIHYVQLRSGHGTQQEHRELALACREVLVAAVPALVEVLS